MNNNQKLILLAIITIFAMFMIYNLKFSDIARCINFVTKDPKVNSDQAEFICLNNILK